jgi:queuine/archaeosine tRNA-ribosyltransferase
MKFFFPDSHDQVDPSFNFETEQRSELRLRHRDDHYAHEEFSTPPFDGILLSMAAIETPGIYTLPQKHRLYRMGIRQFFRLGDKRLETMGDCGAFSYVREERPPYSVEQVVNFYDELGFDYGISVDHVILGFDPRADEQSAPKEWRRRQEITLELAREFLKEHKSRGSRFGPLGVAQGWSPASYAYSVEQLQKAGFSYIAMGGMVPLKTPEISACLEQVNQSRHMNTRLHLLGVTRCEQVREFARFGVVSFDSTSPLRQAFKDSKDNYWTLDRTYSAIRVPQVQANPSLLRKILAGKVNQAEARRLEQDCLRALLLFDAGKASVDDTLTPLVEYERLCGDGTVRLETYRETLLASPWKSCDCDICRRIGIHVILFRGAERNRRRGFHNIYAFHQRLRRELGEEGEVEYLALSPGGIN